MMISYSHWGMHCCYTYPLLGKVAELPELLWAWPHTYFGDSYDAKYLHG